MPQIKALVFDAYGTLFDVHSVITLCDELFPGQGTQLSQTWRAKQLEYTWLKSLMGKYENFEKVTEAALKFACKALKLDCPPQLRKRLMQAYLHLQPYPEVKDALDALSHLKLASLSNGSPRMLK
ncbi:MAG: haloacid dehalogenase type II, partial [Burkholderiales bacterium]